MFYKILNVSKKTKLGMVNIILRGEKDGVKKESARSTGVQVNPAHFNKRMGKVTCKDDLYVEKNAQLAYHWTEMEAIARELDWMGLLPERAAVAQVQESRDEAPAIYAAIKQARLTIVGDQYAKLLLDVQELEAQLAEKRRELETLEIYLNKRPKPLLFSHLLDTYQQMKRDSKKVKDSTLKNFEVLKNVVGRFNKQVLLGDMDLQFFQDFQAHLIGRGVGNASILEMMGKMKTVFRFYARKNGMSTDFLLDFDAVQLGDNNDVMFLTDHEVEELEALDIPVANHGQIDIRRQFLFAIETGLRRSDYNVSRANIQGEELVVATTKSGRVVSIPLSDKARRLLDEAGGSFRLIKEAQFNQTLRRLCEKLPAFQVEVQKFKTVGVENIPTKKKKWEAMSSHVARKTYAFNSLAAGVSTTSVAEWMGHKDTVMLDKHYANKKALARSEAHKILKPKRKKRSSRAVS